MVKTSPGQQHLLVVHGENFAQKDCITNRPMLLLLMRQRLFEFMDDKKSWMSAYHMFDNMYGGKLSDGARDWAKTEFANLTGLWKYFSSKLCKATNSPNDDMRTLKQAYFDFVVATSRPPMDETMPVMNEEDSMPDHIYPNSSDDEFEASQTDAVAEQTALLASPAVLSGGKSIPAEEIIVLESDTDEDRATDENAPRFASPSELLQPPAYVQRTLHGAASIGLH